VLSDLYEGAGREAPAGTLAAGDQAPLAKKEPQEEVKAEESKEPQSPEDLKVKEEPAAERDKKDKKEKKKSRKKNKHPSEEKKAGEGSPEEGTKVRERKRARGETVPGDEETERRPVKTEVGEETGVSGLVPARGSTEAEDLQERVDSYVSSNPGSFELGTLPARRREGSDGAEGGSVSGNRRPAEPAHPPPANRRRGSEDEEIPRRRVRPPKKNKGRNHRVRGWERGYTSQRPRY
jgi:outer membrane biosynthesis protein TonB